MDVKPRRWSMLRYALMMTTASVTHYYIMQSTARTWLRLNPKVEYAPLGDQIQ